MPRRARAKVPPEPDPNEGVFDTAAPPPLAPLRRKPSASLPATSLAPTAPPKASPAPVASPAPATTGPACTCGLGGNLLAQNAVLFWILTGLTYAVGLWLLAYLMMFLYLAWVLASCGEACSQSADACTCQSDSGGDDGGCCTCGGTDSTDDGRSKETPAAGPVGIAAGLASALALRGRLAPPNLAHHPDLPEFRADVWRFRDVRVCVGCSVVYPAFLGAAAAFTLASLPGHWPAWIAVGLGLAGIQTVSSLGLARARWAKAAVKACMGVGLAAYLHGVLLAPWPHLVQGAALTAIVVLAGLSALPRRRRILTALATRA